MSKVRLENWEFRLGCNSIFSPLKSLTKITVFSEVPKIHKFLVIFPREESLV